MDDYFLIGTPVISVPGKMAMIGKNGKLKEVKTLTKTGALATRNKQKVIKLISREGNGRLYVDKIGHTFKEQERKKKYNEINKKLLELRTKRSELFMKMNEFKKNKKLYNEYKNKVFEIDKKIEELNDY